MHALDAIQHDREAHEAFAELVRCARNVLDEFDDHAYTREYQELERAYRRVQGKPQRLYPPEEVTPLYPMITVTDGEPWDVVNQVVRGLNAGGLQQFAPQFMVDAVTAMVSREQFDRAVRRWVNVSPA